jgi:hypothetical protein
MKWLALFLQLLPTLVTSVEKIGSHLSGGDKKEAVKDTLSAVAVGVGVVLPEHAIAASHAATTAVDAIDGVVQVLNDVGALNAHKATAFGSIAGAAPAPAPAALDLDGLHKVVPA